MKSLIFILGLIPTLALAHGEVVDVTSGAVVAVLKQFKASNPEEAKHSFKGIKAWPSGDKIMAKVYVARDGAEVSVSYSCMMDHSNGNDAIVCQKTN